MSIVISVENLSKSYQLGVIGTGTFRGDLQRWWAKLRGLPDPHLKIGEADHGNRQGETLWALKDINFQVQQGEALGIIGRNGAGKSTLLKILSRVTAPTSGEVKVKGRVASLLEVGTGFHPELTGGENITLNGAILGMTRAEIKRKYDEIVDFSGVEQFIDTPVKRYSSGMYVRLAFAVAAHLEPEILVVDEVLAVGDVAFQKKCLGKMGDVAKEGRTVLFVSHNMLAIRALCTRALMLEQGRIVFEGDVSTAVSCYLGEETFRGGGASGDELKAGGDHYNAGGESFLECQEISVLDRSGQPRERFSSSEEIIVSVTFECLQAVPCFYLIIEVESEDQAYILRTENLDDPNNRENSLNPGVYRMTSTFPADLWGNRRYFLSVYLHYQAVQHLRFRRIVSFDVDFQGYSNAFLERPRGKDSFVRPRLRWQTEVVSAKRNDHG